MPTLQATVANCFMAGDEITRRERSCVRDVVRFRCGQYEFVFRQNAVALSASFADHRGDLVDTSVVVVEGVTATKLPTVLRMLDSICWLLSFAGMSRVVRYRYEFPAGSDQTHAHSVVAQSNYFRPAIEIRDGAVARSFVEQVYPTFRSLLRTRRLPVVIDYLVLAESVAQPMEVRLVLLFVALENLKSTFARASGIPFSDGFYRLPPSKPGKKGKAYKFEELLEMMLADVGMKQGLKRIVGLRNDTIHTGVSCKSLAQQRLIYEHAHNVAREYLLRLLRYQGPYFMYSSVGMKSVNL